ncbi:putative galactose-1-phosphate uridyl transferase, class I, HIT-like superfamily [Helianthus annuus]|nr:putative galactose-1-phosphate uridyl transferase, class I, HIT-like superfamily [Helianthus annuus]KAJ0958129.1 putative galactose-1-phosphate uridyl transferase, class I, HIT-like superfamily [Helianthus annuus]
MSPANRNPEIRKDAVNNRTVILSPARSRRPSDFKSKSQAKPDSNPSSDGQPQCPFCAGNEHQCAPEIFRSPEDSTSDWKVRVIENLYPALSRDLKVKSDDDEYCQADVTAGDVSLGGFGFHDVIIESPVHSVHLPDLSASRIAGVLLAYKKRIEQLCAVDSISYVQVFKNHGASAGASMSHSHSQIIALPVIPSTASTRLNSMKEYHNQTGKCVLCNIHTNKLLIDESTHFISISPFASAFPFETWIVPRYHSSHYHELDEDKAIDLGGLLKLTLQKLSVQLNDPPYNYMIHTSPLRITSSQLPYTHWYIQIVPQLSTIGGFEMGTGCYINPVFPEDAAKILREVEMPKSD